MMVKRLESTEEEEENDNNNNNNDVPSRLFWSNVSSLGLWGLVFALALDPPALYSNWTSPSIPPYNNTKMYNPNLDKYKSIPIGDGLYDFIMGNDMNLYHIINQMPDLLRGPKPPILFRNRHLQFIPWLLQNEYHRIRGIPFQQVKLPVMACVVQTTTPTTKNNCTPSPQMTDIVTLDIFPPLPSIKNNKKNQEGNDMMTTDYPQFNSSSPVILFAPGLRCYSQDMPGNMIIRHAYGAGFRSIVVNRRGHSPDIGLGAPRWNLFGDLYDMEQVYWFVKKQLGLAPNTPLFWHGISAGAGLTCSAIGIWDEQRRQHPEYADKIPSFVATMAITPGYDISQCLQPHRFRFPYNALLTPMVQDWFVRRNEDVLRQFNSKVVDDILESTHLQQVLTMAAPLAGYHNASEYYQTNNPMNYIMESNTPMFVLNAVDDPVLHIQVLYEQSRNPKHEGYTISELINQTQKGIVAVTRTGSHCPFLDVPTTTTTTSATSLSMGFWGRFLPALVQDPLFGGYMLDSWADRVSIQYYRAALNVYNERRFM